MISCTYAHSYCEEKNYEVKREERVPERSWPCEPRQSRQETDPLSKWDAERSRDEKTSTVKRKALSAAQERAMGGKFV